MFEGNTDDCFRVAIQLSKSGMKLYADFYKADILVCSPLGLRLILGAEGYVYLHQYIYSLCVNTVCIPSI